jgi:hypothetical protein
MNVSSLGSALAAAVNTPISSDPAGQVQQVAQVSVLKKALQTDNDTTMKLISSVTGMGKNLNVQG